MTLYACKPVQMVNLFHLINQISVNYAIKFVKFVKIILLIVQNVISITFFILKISLVYNFVHKVTLMIKH
jgi:hypothetical protein